jgi:uncharacterized SAM-binding protein YcdF (DUF218 family)
MIFIWALIRISVPILEDFLVMDKPLPHADAMVVMAGSQSERLPAAAALFKKGTASNILLTNDGVLGAYSEEKQRNLYQVEWAESELLKMQVPKKAIVKLSYSSRGSIYDALNTRMVVREKAIKSIIIVTSDYHSKRSFWTFDKILRNNPVVIGIYPVKSKVVAMPYFKKFIPLSLEMIKYIYYNCKYINI